MMFTGTVCFFTNQRRTNDVVVESAAQPPIAGDDDQVDRVHRAAGEQLMQLGPARPASTGRSVPAMLLRIGSVLSPRLRFAHFGGRDRFERARHLRDVLDTANPAFDFSYGAIVFPKTQNVTVTFTDYVYDTTS